MNTVAAISSPSNYRSQAFRYVLLGGFIAGLDDTIYPTVKTLMAGKPWFSPWKGVASGLLGKAAGEGGMEMVALGLALHYFICISAAAFPSNPLATPFHGENHGLPAIRVFTVG